MATIEAALDAGIDLFDTAEGYGDGYSEELLGRVLYGRRQRVAIASKVSAHNLAPSDLEEACLASLRRLRTDYLDLYQIHWPNREVPLTDTVGALEELKRKGMVRAVGVSNFGKGDLSDYLELGRPEVNQLPYNLLWRVIETEILPICQAHEIAVLPYSPLMQGLLTGKFASADEVTEGPRPNPPLRRQPSPGQPRRGRRRGGDLRRHRPYPRDRRRTRSPHGPPGAGLAAAAAPWSRRCWSGARTPEQLLQNLGAADLELGTDNPAAADGGHGRAERPVRHRPRHVAGRGTAPPATVEGLGRDSEPGKQALDEDANPIRDLANQPTIVVLHREHHRQEEDREDGAEDGPAARPGADVGGAGRAEHRAARHRVPRRVRLRRAPRVAGPAAGIPVRGPGRRCPPPGLGGSPGSGRRAPRRSVAGPAAGCLGWRR